MFPASPFFKFWEMWIFMTCFWGIYTEIVFEANTKVAKTPFVQGNSVFVRMLYWPFVHNRHLFNLWQMSCTILLCFVL